MDFLTEEGIERSLLVEQPAVKAHGHWEGESTLRDRRGGPPTPVAIASFLVRDLQTGEPFALATVQRDVTERREAERALSDLADQRQELLARLVQAQEDERHRIAADVHDDSVQALAAVELRLGLLRRQLADADPAVLTSLERAHRSVTDATGRLRHLLFDLESPALRDDLATGLAEAADFVLEDTGVRWTMTGDRAVDLPQAARVTAYRVAKEALVNVRKHARHGRSRSTWRGSRRGCWWWWPTTGAACPRTTWSTARATSGSRASGTGPGSPGDGYGWRRGPVGARRCGCGCPTPLPRPTRRRPGRGAVGPCHRAPREDHP